MTPNALFGADLSALISARSDERAFFNVFSALFFTVPTASTASTAPFEARPNCFNQHRTPSLRVGVVLKQGERSRAERGFKTLGSWNRKFLQGRVRKMNTQKTTDSPLVLDRPDVVLPNGRVWHWLADVPHERLDGSQTTLAVWHSPCARCGAPVFVGTPASVGSDASKSKAFGRVHCDEHKLSPAEAKLNFIAACRKGRQAQREKRKAGAL